MRTQLANALQLAGGTDDAPDPLRTEHIIFDITMQKTHGKPFLCDMMPDCADGNNPVINLVYPNLELELTDTMSHRMPLAAMFARAKKQCSKA